MNWFRERIKAGFDAWPGRQCGIFSWAYDAKKDAEKLFEDLDAFHLDPINLQELRHTYAPMNGTFVGVHIDRWSGLAQLPKGCIVPSPAAMIMLAATYMNMIIPSPAVYEKHFWFPIDEERTKFQISVVRNRPGSAFRPLEVTLSHSDRVTQENSVTMVYAVVWKPRSKDETPSD